MRTLAGIGAVLQCGGKVPDGWGRDDGRPAAQRTALPAAPQHERRVQQTVCIPRLIGARGDVEALQNATLARSAATARNRPAAADAVGESAGDRVMYDELVCGPEARCECATVSSSVRIVSAVDGDVRGRNHYRESGYESDVPGVHTVPA